MKKILVTGSSGYIGRHLVHMLNEDYEVTGLDIKYVPQLGKYFIEQDINNMICLDEQYDTVIHLAALVNVGDSMKWPMCYYQTNVGGTLNVMERVSYDNFIFASTGAAVDAISPYALSKKATESMVRNYCTLNGKGRTIFRFYNVIGSVAYGPTNQDGLMFNLMKARETGEFNLYGNDYNTFDGTAVRDYIHVLEVCEAIKSAIEQPSTLLLENLGTGQGYTVQQIINTFKKVNGCDFKVNVMPRREGDLAHSVLHDVSPYMKKTYTLEQMLKV
jgi:UDP-glucose 4-epimerase